MRLKTQNCKPLLRRMILSRKDTGRSLFDLTAFLSILSM